MEFKTGGLADIGGIGESWAGKPTVAVTQISSLVSSIAGMFEANRHAYDIHLKTKFQVPANCAVWVQKIGGPDWNSTRLILHWFSEVLDGGSKVLRLPEYSLLRDLGFIESIDRLRAALFIAGTHYQSKQGVDPELLSEAETALLSQRLKHWKEDLVDGVIDLNDRLKLARLKLESEHIKKPDGAGAQKKLKARVPAGPWPEVDRDAIRECLSGQQLKLFNLLWGQSRWTYYGTLKNARADKLWRGQPDPGDVQDTTVFEALRKLQKAMPPESPYDLKIEHESLRAKIER